MAATIEFRRPDGKTANGYLAEPAAGSGPGVIVIQEWWGLNDQIRSVARRLADAGYAALVPDLYRGKSTLEEQEAHHLMSGLDFGDAATQDVRGAAQYLKARCAPAGAEAGAKVGVTGFCMGGALTWLALANVPEVDAGVAWYGMPPLEFIDASNIKVPVLAHWATQDAFFPVANVDALEAKLAAAGVAYQGHRYLAHHAFANETAVGRGRIANTQFDRAWARMAWDRTLRFFGRHLG